MNSVGMQLRHRQHLTLTPRLQQSVRLLQLSALEFQQELQQALASNPFLDEAENEEDEEQTGTTDESSAGDPASKEDAAGVDSLEERSDSHEDYVEAAPSQPHEDGEGDWTDWTEATPSLRDHLTEQLRLCHLAPRDDTLCQLLIQALDEDGYLRLAFEELAHLVPFGESVQPEEWNAALKLVQSLEPAGIGARDLRECLLCQLPPPAECTPREHLARRILTEHIQVLARRDTAQLRRWLEASEEDVRAACDLIRRLDPHPGWRFGRPDVRYVVPDVIVHKVKGQWVVSVNPAVLPRIRLNQRYAELFQSSRESGHAQLAGQLQEARWLIRSSEQRFSTILRVAECIVAKQRAFLEYGDLAMKPLGLRHIAEEVGVHESTVSRVTSNKYMATPRGLIEFRRFFSRELPTDTGGTCSATAIRALIKEMIGVECRTNPYSDAQLAQLLGGQGLRVARRTVTKYRRQLQLPSVEIRRQAA